MGNYKYRILLCEKCHVRIEIDTLGAVRCTKCGKPITKEVDKHTQRITNYNEHLESKDIKEESTT